MPQIAKVYINAAKASQKAYGVPASVSLAQFVLESGYGKYDLGANNFFGIKYGKNVKCDGFVEKRTKEFVKGKYITISTVGEKAQAFVPAPLPPLQARGAGTLSR